jgi:hypothetical protein
MQKRKYFVGAKVFPLWAGSATGVEFRFSVFAETRTLFTDLVAADGPHQESGSSISNRRGPKLILNSLFVNQFNGSLVLKEKGFEKSPAFLLYSAALL